MKQIQHFSSLAILVFLIWSCKNQITHDIKESYYEAFNNNSTSSNYVVFTAVDLQTNNSKEICCSSRSLIDAFIQQDLSHIDSISLFNSYYKAKKTYDSILNSQCCEYTFKFKNPESLKEIGFYKYNSDSVKYYSMQNDVSILIDYIQRNFNDTIHFFLIDHYKTDSEYLIHVLYKNGIMCKKDCGTGYAYVNKILR